MCKVRTNLLLTGGRDIHEENMRELLEDVGAEGLTRVDRVAIKDQESLAIFR
jgi:hypothetical protein